MKKILIIAAAIVALASCTKVEKYQGEDTPLTFKVLGYLQQTKANTAYTGTEFGTFAYWTSTDWATDGDKNVFMNNDRIAQNPSYAPAGEWGPDAQRFWPKTGKLSFASYSPYTDGTTNGFSEVPVFSKATGFVFNNFTISSNGTVDLMVADFVADQTKNDPQYQLSGNTDGVPTLFRHLLSQISFRFQTVDNPNPNIEETEIVIKQVVIRNISDSGDYNQSNDPVWSDQSGDASYEFNPATGNDVVVTPGAAPVGTAVDSYILMPQDLTSGTQVVDIDYVIRTKYTSNPDWEEEEVSVTVDLVTPEVSSWDPNESVVYTITVNPVSDQSILFDPAVADWTPTPANATTLN